MNVSGRKLYCNCSCAERVKRNLNQRNGEVTDEDDGQTSRRLRPELIRSTIRWPDVIFTDAMHLVS